jgi:hypothetical protein
MRIADRERIGGDYIQMAPGGRHDDRGMRCGFRVCGPYAQNWDVKVVDVEVYCSNNRTCKGAYR